MSSELVTIVIPTYNDDPEHLHEAVASARSQTHPHLEVIVVDDGSTRPETLHALDDLETSLTVVHQSNGGPSAARNVGIRAGSGELIICLDADDVLSPDQEVLERLRGVEEHFGVRVLPEGFEATGPISAADVLVPGARVCFSGTVHSPRHGWLEKEQLHAMAEARGLVAVSTFTKTRTDVLVVAEAGSQSTKAKNAARWEKPVLTAEEFLEWVG